MTHLWTALLPLVVKGPDPDKVKPGWLGFGVFLALAVAVVLLWLSFRKQLKKVDFDEDATTRKPGETAGPAKTDETDETNETNGTASPA